MKVESFTFINTLLLQSGYTDRTPHIIGHLESYSLCADYICTVGGFALPCSLSNQVLSNMCEILGESRSPSEIETEIREYYKHETFGTYFCVQKDTVIVDMKHIAETYLE